MDKNQNCWDRRSPLEKGLILVLIVAIPYIIVLTSVCSYYGYTKGKDVAHERKHLETTTITTPKKVSFQKIHDDDADKKKRKRSVTEECRTNCNLTLCADYRFLVSISEYLYVDDQTEYRYKCTGVLLSYNLCLMGLECYNIGEKLTSSISIRAGSNYWSYDGYVRTDNVLKEVTPIFVIFNLVTPFYEDFRRIDIVSMSEKMDINTNTEFDMYRWDTSFIYDYEQRRKFIKAEKIIMKVAREKCQNYPVLQNVTVICATEPLNGRSCSKYYHVDQSPIFLKDTNVLLGIEIKRHCVEGNVLEHYYASLLNYSEYLKQVVRNNSIEYL